MGGNKGIIEDGHLIVFYCKDCGDIVQTDRCGRKYVYKCKKCGTKNVAFGTKKSIYSFFHLSDEELAAKRAAAEENAKSEEKNGKIDARSEGERVAQGVRK